MNEIQTFFMYLQLRARTTFHTFYSYSKIGLNKHQRFISTQENSRYCWEKMSYLETFQSVTLCVCSSTSVIHCSYRCHKSCHDSFCILHTCLMYFEKSSAATGLGVRTKDASWMGGETSSWIYNWLLWFMRLCWSTWFKKKHMKFNLELDLSVV